MKFNPCKCPQCGEPPTGTIEEIPGLALLSPPDEDGTFDYCGETKVDWDGQRTVREPDGRVTLVCENDHEWEVEILDDNEPLSKPKRFVVGLKQSVSATAIVEVEATSEAKANRKAIDLAAAGELSWNPPVEEVSVRYTTTPDNVEMFEE